MRYFDLRFGGTAALSLALAGCSGGGGGMASGGSSGSGAATVQEVTDPAVVPLADRAAPGDAILGVQAIVDGATVSVDSTTLTYATGGLAGGQLDGENLDGAGFSNPADGEYSRVVATSGTGTLFGTLGLLTDPASDLPVDGTTAYNAGWVGMTAVTASDIFTLEGRATLTANWDDSQLTGRFDNLSGTDATDRAVSNVGTVTLRNATITGSGFAGGTVTGTGIFAALDGDSMTDGTAGQFYGPQADELGGVLFINDDAVSAIGAFQAD